MQAGGDGVPEAEHQDAMLSISASSKYADVLEPTTLEDASQDRVGLQLRIEIVEGDVPEEPAHALREATSHARMMAHHSEP